MRKDLQELHQIANKSEKRVLGLMSGTSLDGLDMALCSISGTGVNTQVKLEIFESVGYTDQFKSAIKEVFALRNIDLEVLTLLNVQIAEEFAFKIRSFLERNGVNPASVDLVASHGQTVYHAPKRLHKRPDAPNATLQLGDGDHLAMLSGIITLSDFRQKELASGGEGAPLSKYADYLLFSKPEKDQVLLNIGGIANFTYLPASCSFDQVMATDTGPGNTLMDACARRFFRAEFDRDGAIAQKGSVDHQLLNTLLSDPYFSHPQPKTTGQEQFNWDWLGQVLGPTPVIEPKDLMATLSELTAETIVQRNSPTQFPA